MSEDLVEARADESLPDEAPPTAPPAAGSAWDRWRERRRNRVSRWDRPPPPKDWRYFVGGFGKILIATGLLKFGFVAYQLWGTGIETARAQNRLENTFEEQFEAAVADRDITTPDIDTDTDQDADAVIDDAATDTDPGSSVEDADPETPPTSPGFGGAKSDIVPGAVDLSDGAVEQDVPVVPGEAFA